MMQEHIKAMPGSYVIVFFHTRNGELCCRVTDVAERKTWIVPRVSVLWQLLNERNGLDAAAASEHTG